MADHDVREDPAVFYDHESEDPRGSGRRRGPVADWGVGDELFDHLPRRRFRPSESPRRDTHASEDYLRERRFAPAEASGEARGTGDELGSTEPAASREDAIDGPAASRGGGIDEPGAGPASGVAPDFVEDARAREGVATVHGVTAADEDEEAPRATLDTVALPGEGRRTVVIRGHGAHAPVTTRRARPPRTAVERVGHRPERLAAWAVALGFLLILIAILTAHG
jgi:hypothetical protein